MRTLRDSTGLFKKNVWTKCASTFSHTKRRSKTISSTTTGNGCTWASILFLRFKKSSKVFQAIDQRTYRHQFVYLGGDFRSFELISAETHLRSQGEEDPPPTKNGLGGGESSRKERGGTREGCPVRMQFHTCGDHGVQKWSLVVRYLRHLLPAIAGGTPLVLVRRRTTDAPPV